MRHKYTKLEWILSKFPQLPWQECSAQSQEARAETAMQSCDCYELGMHYTHEHIASGLQSVNGIACLIWPTALHCCTSVLAGLRQHSL